MILSHKGQDVILSTIWKKHEIGYFPRLPMLSCDSTVAFVIRITVLHIRLLWIYVDGIMD